MSTSRGQEPGIEAAAAAFRAYFDELQARFLEREDVLLQLQLALLSQEHVLLVGPPGTGKSALAENVLGRIVEPSDDGAPPRPNLFSRQLTESTVQTDLIGPVDFKVLTETGRTEYLTAEGMLGARFAFLDEVFDGRDMLLRAILNVLHERELKHGRRVTVGKVQTAVLTSNRYLSEVLERSPELLVAFADRVAFVAYVPKSFVHARSRATMLEQGLKGQRPRLQAQLGLDALGTLQGLVRSVEVPSQVAAALELLSDGLEKRVLSRSASLPGYRPTRIFSARGLVKAQDVLRAAVVHARIWREPGRKLVARLEDLEAVRACLVLGGPRGKGPSPLLDQIADPRERLQLEIVRLEEVAFDEALAEAKAGVQRAEAHEAQRLSIDRWIEAASALGDDVDPGAVVRVVEGISTALVPGPRHASNRPPLLSAARSALLVLRQSLQQQLRAFEGQEVVHTQRAVQLACALLAQVPELADERGPMAAGSLAWLEQRADLLAADVETRALEGAQDLVRLTELAEKVGRVVMELESLAAGLVELSAGPEGAATAPLTSLRPRLGRALGRCVRGAFHSLSDEDAGPERPLAYRQLEPHLIAIDPSLGALREELVEPLSRRRAVDALSAVESGSVGAVTRWLRGVVEHFRLEALPLTALMTELGPLLSAWLETRVATLEAQPSEPPSIKYTDLFDASIYGAYVSGFSSTVADGESAALDELSRLLDETGHGEGVIGPTVRERLVGLELRTLEARTHFLLRWFAQLLQALPDPSEVQTPKEARTVLDRLVRSHFPLLALREGELFRIASGVTRLRAIAPSGGERADAVRSRIEQLQRELEALGEGLLARQES